MPPKKRTKCSYEFIEATRRSERSTQGQGGHAEQLKKAGETLVATARKKTILDISDAEENPMAPSQLQKSKKNATTEKPTQCSVGVNRNVNSGHQHSSTSLRPVPSTAHSSGRFGFQQPMSTSSQSIWKAPWSSDRTCEESRRQVTERDIDVDRQDQYQANGENKQRDGVQDETLETAGDTMDSGQRTNDLGSGNEGGAQEDLNYGDDELDAGDDELDAGDDLNQGIDGDYNDEPDAQENDDGFDNATGDKSEESGGVYDVLKHHQTKNGKCKAPSPAYLSRVKHVERRHDSGHSKSPRQPSPQHVVSARSSALVQPPIRLQFDILHCLLDTHLSVLPPACTCIIHNIQGLQFDVLHCLLDTHLSILPPHAVSSIEMRYNLHKKSSMLNCYFLQYVVQMSWLLCDDLFTFCTELKKVVISITKTSYKIFPKGMVARKDKMEKHVIANTTNNSKKALKNTDEFQCAIPINGLLLMVMKGVITGFCETSTDKVPDLSADKCRANFNSLRKSVDTLMDNIDCCVELEEMLQQWAMIGMGDLDFDGGSVGGSDMEDVNVIL
ncbi:hypothetical protein DFH29DRAFT_879205 [Suillus ampliporus]|nr:hypothetical protein DFH29DRAFT_879205 [Suillus ampliporus]